MADHKPPPSGLKNKIARNADASARLTTGPATDIFPFLLTPTGPDIMTAPGAAKTNPENDITIASRRKKLEARNSAKQPYLWATNLWASSCRRKPTPTVRDAIMKFA